MGLQVTASDERRVLGDAPTSILIGGEWVPASTGATFPVEDPSTGKQLAEVADGSAEDMVHALDAADGVRAEWAATPPRNRSEVLRNAYETMIARAGDLALLMTLEMGKPLADSAAEVAYAAEFLRWFSEEAVRIDGRWTVAPTGGSRLVVMHQPVGPCLLITPWNFPAAMITRKVGPAVAAGCTMVLKPAESTPLSALALGAIFREAGLPGGVFNVVPTSDPANVGAILGDRRLRKLSFTGSTATGQSLLAQAAPGVLRTSMELGGNAPFLVFGDADLDAAIEGAMIAKMRNMGEACTAANRFLVHESIAGTFASRLAARMGALRVGRGTEPGVEVGPLISSAAREKVAGLVDASVAGGAHVVAGGRSLPGAGYFYEPTVLAGVEPTMVTGEIFGPVAPVMTFDSVEEALSVANGTPYGLVAYLYTRDLERAVQVSEALEYGMVGVNTGIVSNPAAPFGGVKKSGIGREGGHAGIHEYLETKYVALKMSG